ncbi:MAG: argininosuccinate lyase [Chloroflexi bacterium]|nr:argininosuccinate lyase [Chloroflexota bacterium]
MNKKNNFTHSVSGDNLEDDFTSSIDIDKQMYEEDIRGSIAHTQMLAKQQIITKKDKEKIISGLLAIKKEILSNKFEWKSSLEDIHMNIESRLYDHIGEIAGKLHTARSRNDQVATDVRMWTKKICVQIISKIAELQSSFVKIAEKNIDTILPGYTHMQKGQPISLAHHFLAYYEMLKRDLNRFQQVYSSADVMILGSGALSGVNYPVDREWLAKELDFSKISNNSMDGVSDRDFIVEFINACSLVMTHLSRFSEEIIIWSSEEFQFIKISDKFSTGSSMMPQKRNPDYAELVRGKTGSVFGSLFGMFTILKGLPLTYNRDLQEDKKHLFESAATTIKCLDVTDGIIQNIKINKDTMLSSAKNSFILATDIADYLVKKGIPFRESYVIISNLTKELTKKNIMISELTINDYKKYSQYFEEDILNLSLETAIESKNSVGGTAKKIVEKALSQAKKEIKITTDQYEKN